MRRSPVGGAYPMASPSRGLPSTYAIEPFGPTAKSWTLSRPSSIDLVLPVFTFTQPISSYPLSMRSTSQL